MLDTTHPVETPEGVVIELLLAGPLPRAAAWLIDAAIRIFSLTLLGLLLLLFFGNIGAGVWLILYFLTDWLYPVFFEVYYKGQTPGKRAMSLAVVH